MSMAGKHRSFQEQVEKQPDYRYDVRNEIIINNGTMIFEEEYNVKVLMLNGSAKANGNTYASLLEVGRQLDQVHGAVPGEACQDEEGMQTMRNLARNLAWMMKCFAAGKAAGVELPQTERDYKTNFIR